MPKLKDVILIIRMDMHFQHDGNICMKDFQIIGLVAAVQLVGFQNLQDLAEQDYCLRG